MVESIASRVTRVIGGSVHALLDAMENAAPEAVMGQAIREVDQAIDDVRVELGRAEADKHLATSSLNKLNTQNEDLAGQIELALAKGDDDLARAGIARQVDIEDQLPVLQRSLQEAMERSRELEAYVVALLAKKREMEGALRDFIASRAIAAAPARSGSGSSGRVQGKSQDRVERAGAAFDRVISGQTGVDGVTAPINPDASKLQELRELARRHRIDERLAALKVSQQR